MNVNHEQTWETYVASWKTVTPAEKRALFEKCLDFACEYNDPLVNTKGWNDLEAYMLDFHQQAPGAHFVTTYFLTHNNKSIARWEMKNANNSVLGSGISYGEYNKSGLLVSIAGFFELPNQRKEIR
jgi:hypothetical protein